DDGVDLLGDEGLAAALHRRRVAVAAADLDLPAERLRGRLDLLDPDAQVLRGRGARDDADRAVARVLQTAAAAVGRGALGAGAEARGAAVVVVVAAAGGEAECQDAGREGRRKGAQVDHVQGPPP